MPRFLSRARISISGWIVGFLHIWRSPSCGPQFGHPETRPNPHREHTKPTPNPERSRRHAHKKPTPNSAPRRNSGRTLTERTPKLHQAHTNHTLRAHQAHIKPITQKTASAHTPTPNPQRSTRHVHIMVHTKPRPNPESVDSMRGTRRNRTLNITNGSFAARGYFKKRQAVS